MTTMTETTVVYYFLAWLTTDAHKPRINSKQTRRQLQAMTSWIWVAVDVNLTRLPVEGRQDGAMSVKIFPVREQ